MASHRQEISITREDGRYEDFEENYPFNTNSQLSRGARHTVMEYVSREIKLSTQIGSLLYTDSLPPNAGVTGNVHIRATKDLRTWNFIGPVNILISTTARINNSVTTTTVNIEATRFNNKFDGKYFIECITTRSRGTPKTTIETNMLTYEDGLKQGKAWFDERADGITTSSIAKEYNRDMLVNTTVVIPSAKPLLSVVDY